MLGDGLNSLIPNRNNNPNLTGDFVNPNSLTPEIKPVAVSLDSINPVAPTPTPEATVATPAPVPTNPIPQPTPVPEPIAPTSTPTPQPTTPPIKIINPPVPQPPSTGGSSPDITPISNSTPAGDLISDNKPIPKPTLATPSTSELKGGKNPTPTEHVFLIEVDKIKPNPFQPRRFFNEDALKELASSITEHGVLQPIVISKKVTDTPTGTDVEYELIAGERRLRASKLAGLVRVPAIIKNTPPKKEKLELAIIENLQREDLNPIESARAFAQLQDDYGMTQREVATRLGKSREVIANSMRLLSLPSYIQEAVAKGQISESQARLLISVSNLNSQQKLFEDLIKNSLTVRELRNKVSSINAGHNAIDRYTNKDPELKHLEERLSELLGTRVKVDKNGSTGKITISFSSEDELKNIVDIVSPHEDDLDS